MLTHVKTLGILNVVLSALGILAGIFCLLFFSGIAGIVGMAEHGHERMVAIPILGAIGLLVCVILLLVSVPGLITGIGLLKMWPWARVLGIVVSALHLLNFPFGTALGVYGLWVLTSTDTARIFDGMRRAT